MGQEIETSSENRSGIVGFDPEAESTAEELQQLEAELEALEGAIEGSQNVETAESAIGEPATTTTTTTLSATEATESSVSTECDDGRAETTTAEPCRGSLIASSHDLGASCNMRLTESELRHGKIKPNWVPDADSLICMLCETKFSVLKRRHHCRACGRVLCGECCNKKAFLGQ